MSQSKIECDISHIITHAYYKLLYISYKHTLNELNNSDELNSSKVIVTLKKAIFSSVKDMQNFNKTINQIVSYLHLELEDMQATASYERNRKSPELLKALESIYLAYQDRRNQIVNYIADLNALSSYIDITQDISKYIPSSLLPVNYKDFNVTNTIVEVPYLQESVYKLNQERTDRLKLFLDIIYIWEARSLIGA